MLGDSRGVTTVFLSIVLSALILVGMMLADGARIILAQRQLKSALDSALRSGLALCHEGLAAEFGLYGTTMEKEAIEAYLRLNLPAYRDAVNFVELEILDVEVEKGSADSLLNKGELREQVLQYMKYKAPLVVGENILSKLGGCGWDNKLDVMAAGQEAVVLRKGLQEECSGLNRKLEGLLDSLKRGDSPAHLLLQLEEISGDLDFRVMPALETYETAVKKFVNKEGREGVDPLRETEAISLKAKELKAKLQSCIQGVKGNTEETGQELTPDMRGFFFYLENHDGFGLPYEKPRVESDGNKTEMILSFLHDYLSLRTLSPEDLIARGEFKESNEAEKQDMGADYLALADKEEYYEMKEEFAAAQGNKVFFFLDSLREKLMQHSQGSRDNLYQVEYIMDKYTYLTSSTMREHYFEKGEVEYILCGNSSELANLLMVYQSIWFFRYAVNVLDIFVKSPLPEPMARLSDALARGFVEAGLEVVQLYNGEGVPFWPDFPNTRLTYSDYLRVFLLLQDKNSQLERMSQLIQVNMKRMQKDNNFQLAALYCTGRVRALAEIELWFLPARAFERLGLKHFRDGKCRIVQETVLSY